MSNLNPFKMISNIENQNIQFKKIGILEAVFVGFIYAILVAFGQSYPINIKNLLLTSIFKISILILIFIIVVFAFYNLYTSETCGKNDLSKKITIKNIAFLTIAVVGIRLITSSIDAYLILFQKITISPIVDVSKALNKTPFYLIIYAYILGPIMEEFICRGVILGGLLKKYSVKLSILVSSLIFGIIHFTVIQLITGFLVGAFLGYLYIKTQSIYFCMFGHILINIIGSLYSFKYNTSLILVLSSCFIIGFILMILGFKKLTSNIDKSELHIASGA